MRLKTKQYAKLAVTSLIAAFSFGLTISCVSNHKQNINKVFAADDVSTTWSYNPDNKALTCTSASNYPNGFIMETNQVSVTGLGGGQYEIAYNVLGYPSNSVQPDYTDYGTFTLVFISGSYDSTPSTDGPYGSITAYPLDVSGLDSNTEYEIYIKVEPTGDMNEQGSGEGDDENAGTWTWNEDTQKLSFQFDHTETAGYVSTTSQTMVHGNGNGSFDIGYDLWGTPANATTASNDLLASKTITIYDGYYDEDNSTVTGNPSAISGLQSYGQITIKVDVDTSGTMTSDGWLVNDGDLYFYVLADVNPASIDSITWNNSSGNGTGEAILSVTISTSGGSFQQVYQINNPTFSPELEGTSGTTLGNTTVEGISEWSDRYVTVDISNKSYSLGESTQELESIQITIDGEPVDYIPILLGDSVDLGVILSPSGATASLQWEDPNETGCYTITQTGEYTAHIEAVQLGDASIRVRAIDTQISKTIPLYINQPTQEAEYTVRFDGNGATSGSMSDDIFTTDIVSSYPYILLDCGFERDGYTFAGWGSTDGGSPEWQPTETAYIEPGETIFYAIWESTAPQQGTEYIVIFNGNGATSGSMSDDSFTTTLEEYQYSFPYELPECGYSRDGYVFAGWGLTETALLKWQPGETRDIQPGETTFFAIWAEQFTITFEANGGSGYMEPVTVASGDRPTVPGCDFTCEGYSFVCWAVNSPSSSMTVNPGDTVTVNQDYVLYAVWEPNGPVQHEGMWYDEDLHKLRFYNTDIEGGIELPVELEVIILDYGPNTSLTRAEIEAYVYYEGDVWGTYSYEMRTFEVGVENSKKFISGQIDVDYDQSYEQVKLYPEIFYNNVFKPGQLNYVEGYNQIYYVNDSYDSAVVEPEVVEFNEITRVFTIEAYAVDVTGETDLNEFTFELTDGVVLEGNLNQDAQVIEGYFAELGRRIKLNVFYIEYNSLEEEAITPETIEDIGNAMDAVELSSDQINQINQKIEDNKEQIPDSTGGKIADALTNTAPTLSDDPEVLETQKDVIVAVVETVIEVETNRPSDIGQSVRTDSSLPANAGISIEQEVREFYELQMANLIGEEKDNRRGILRAPTATDYKIDVSGKTKEELQQDLNDYGTMTEFIDDSVQNMNTAGRKLRSCSGQAMKVEVKRTVVKIKTSSFRDFDKDAADLQFAYDVHNAMMLHLQEVVVTELEKDYKPSGNKEKDEQYQQELAACKDIESFTEIVIEVLRQKYNAITDSNVEYDDFVQIDDEGKYKGIYWDIFEAWCLDKPCPYPITFQELTDATVDTTTQNARSFELNTEVTNTEVVFTAAFVGGGVAFISLAGVLGYILKKRSLKGVIK